MTTITPGARPPQDPGELLSGIRGFITGHRTTAGYGAFADWVRELDRQLSGGARIPAEWHGVPVVMAAAMRECSARWRAEADAEGAATAPAMALLACAEDMDALLSIIICDQGPPDPIALVSVALGLLGLALEGQR
jgi:hypothetical protein